MGQKLLFSHEEMGTSQEMSLKLRALIMSEFVWQDCSHNLLQSWVISSFCYVAFQDALFFPSQSRGKDPVTYEPRLLDAGCSDAVAVAA